MITTDSLKTKGTVLVQLLDAAGKVKETLSGHTYATTVLTL
jgi:hypothetical protein